VRRGKKETLVGPRVELRPLKGADFEAWRAVRERSRDWLEPWEPMPDPTSPDPVRDPEAFRARCGAWERQRHFDTAYGFGMFLRGREFIGEVSLGSVQRGPFQSAFVGYWVDEEHAGKGAIVPRNAASRRVVEKLGLREEGLAERFLQIRGVWEDHSRFAITVEEWGERANEIVGKFLS